MRRIFNDLLRLRLRHAYPSAGANHPFHVNSAVLALLDLLETRLLLYYLLVRVVIVHLLGHLLGVVDASFWLGVFYYNLRKNLCVGPLH